MEKYGVPLRYAGAQAGRMLNPTEQTPEDYAMTDDETPIVVNTKQGVGIPTPATEAVAAEGTLTDPVTGRDKELRADGRYYFVGTDELADLDPLADRSDPALGMYRGGLVQRLRKGGQPKKQTSWYDDLAIAVSRRSNDLVAAAADLADKYGITPAQSAAWVAKQMGHSPQEVAAIRRNLGSVGNFRNVVNAGAASNEQRFRQQGGRGSRAPSMVTPPVRMADVAYRTADIPRAVVSETPRALEAAGNYIRNTTPRQAMQDAQRVGGVVADMVTEDPYGFAFDIPFYAAFPKSAATSDFATMRSASRTLEPYASDPDAAQTKRMVDALSVLPLSVAPYAARRMLPSAARRVSRR
jgi:hypothetical protein